MATVELTIDPEVFNPVYLPLLTDQRRTQIYFGGSSSGKSYFLAQRAVLDVAGGDHNYLITRKEASTIASSVYNEILKAIRFFKLEDYFVPKISPPTITCKNGYQILFAGLDDPEKVKSITPQLGVITDIWQEEATKDDYGDYKQLEKRLRGWSKVPKRHHLSFNPILQDHWIYTEFFRNWREDQNRYQADNLTILKTTYKDNKFLMPDDIAALEDESDRYFYEVYTLGNWGVLGGVIFNNWSVEPLDEIYKQTHQFCNGLDFGFAKDPAAMLHMSFDRRKCFLYIFDELYETGLTNDLLAASIRPIIGKQTVICDSSEPKSIQELRNNKISAVPAVKGRDSVNFGIQWLQQIQIVVDPKCVNTIRELKSYRWKEDRHGNTLREPIDKDNHCMDAMRYGTEPEQGKDPFRETLRARPPEPYNPYKRRR